MRRWLLYPMLGLVALLAVAVVVLLILGSRADAGRFSASVVIARSPDAVWPWLRDPERLKTWVSWLVEVRREGAGRATWVMEDPNNGGKRVEIVGDATVEDAPRRLVVSASATGWFNGEMAYDLTDLGDGRTRLAVDEAWSYGSWIGRLFEPLVTPQARRKLDMDLIRLKASAEAGATP